MKSFLTVQSAALAGVILGGIFSLPTANADPTLVTPANMNGWSFVPTGNSSITQMVPGPATPPLGIGSAELADSPQFVFNQPLDIGSYITAPASYNGAAFSSLTALTYSTYVSSSNAYGTQFPTMFLALSFNGSNNEDDVLAFDPANNVDVNSNLETNDKWQTWNTLLSTAVWVDVNGTSMTYADWQTYLAANYTSVTLTPFTFGPYNGQGIFLGEGLTYVDGTGAVLNPADGYVDNVTIDTGSGPTTFNLDPVPEPASLSLLALGAAGLLLRRRKA